MYLTSFVTIRIGIELVAVQRKLPDRVVVGLQLNSVRTFHVNLSPRIYKGGQVPPRKISTPKAIQTTTHDDGVVGSRSSVRFWITLVVGGARHTNPASDLKT